MITLLSPKLIHIYFETQALLAPAGWAPQLKLPHLSAASFCFCKLASQGGKKKKEGGGECLVKPWHAVLAPHPCQCPGDKTLQILPGALSHNNNRDGTKQYEPAFGGGRCWRMGSWTAFSALILASPVQTSRTELPAFSKAPSSREEHSWKQHTFLPPSRGTKPEHFTNSNNALATANLWSRHSLKTPQRNTRTLHWNLGPNQIHTFTHQAIQKKNTQSLNWPHLLQA